MNSLKHTTVQGQKVCTKFQFFNQICQDWKFFNQQLFFFVYSSSNLDFCAIHHMCFAKVHIYGLRVQKSFNSSIVTAFKNKQLMLYFDTYKTQNSQLSPEVIHSLIMTRLLQPWWLAYHYSAPKHTLSSRCASCVSNWLASSPPKFMVIDLEVCQLTTN